jgi:hypothetical protein
MFKYRISYESWCPGWDWKTGTTQYKYTVLWRIDPLLGKDLETNNETTTVAMQRGGKHASTTIELLLETVILYPLLSSRNS